jgi:5-amino-6-(5-phosphoribosylamino)uracil reductase
MRRLWPDPAEVGDVAALIAAEKRPPLPHRPWLLVNMVSSLDGAIAVDGRSGGLGGPADKEVFHALRGVADVILVGAGTVRAESYGPPRPSEATKTARVARGQAATPRLAIVTRSLDLDGSRRLFQEAPEPPIVITSTAADDERRAALSTSAEILIAGRDQVDLAESLRQLGAQGVSVVLCEGGPALNGDLIAGDLIDEWNLTLSPQLVSGGDGRASRGPTAAPSGLALRRLLEADGVLRGAWARRG